MDKHYKKEGKYSYFEAGEGTPIVILHGLMGGLSNFDGVAQYFPSKGYKVVIPDLPIYTQSILKTNVKSFAKYVKDFITFKPKMIIAQIEADGNFQKFINVCKQNQIGVGISIMPKTDISVLESFIPQTDYLQCMGSNQIGHHGVGLENSAVEKIKILKAIYPENLIGIDIGVNLENKDILQKAGADVLVVGSAILNAENPAEVYEQLKK